MRLTFTVEGAETVTLDVPVGENVWIAREGVDNPAGSLYLASDGTDDGLTIGLGRYSEETAWWEYENELPI